MCVKLVMPVMKELLSLGLEKAMHVFHCMIATSYVYHLCGKMPSALQSSLRSARGENVGRGLMPLALAL